MRPKLFLVFILVNNTCSYHSDTPNWIRRLNLEIR